MFYNATVNVFLNSVFKCLLLVYRNIHFYIELIYYDLSHFLVRPSFFGFLFVFSNAHTFQCTHFDA